MSLQSFGVIGLAVMGENIALNVERNGFPIAVYNRTKAKTDNFMATRAQGKNVVAADSIPAFCAALETPRKILIMVQAGKPVDLVIEELKPFLSPGDAIIDGGNNTISVSAAAHAAHASWMSILGILLLSLAFEH